MLGFIDLIFIGLVLFEYVKRNGKRELRFKKVFVDVKGIGMNYDVK